MPHNQGGGICPEQSPLAPSPLPPQRAWSKGWPEGQVSLKPGVADGMAEGQTSLQQLFRLAWSELKVLNYLGHILKLCYFTEKIGT